MKAIKFFATLFAAVVMFAACEPKPGPVVPPVGGDSPDVEELTIPGVANPEAGKTTVVLYVPEDTPEGCYAVGTVNGWGEKNTDLKFVAVEGAESDRWVSYTFDYASDMQIKVCAIPSDPDVTPGWTYQWGKNIDPENDLEEDNVIILDGSNGGELELEHQGQPKLKGLVDGGVVYIHIKAWAETPIIKPVPAATAWIKHPWNGASAWTWCEMTKVAEGKFEYAGRFGSNGVNINTVGDGDGAWYPGDQVEGFADMAQGDSVKFTFVSEKGVIGKVSVVLIEKGTSEPEEPKETKDITVKAKVPAAWTNTITAWVWATGGNGKEVVPTKEGDWYVVTENCAELNIIFKNGEGWNGNANQTEDITGLTEDSCYELAQEGEAKATATAVDCE